MYQYLNTITQDISYYLNTIQGADSKVFYETRLSKFYREYMSLTHNILRPIHTINFHDINTFIDGLDCSQAEKLNYYYAFKGFFTYAYQSDILPSDIMKGVQKPTVVKKQKRYISSQDVIKLKKFIHEKLYPLEYRLLLGLFLYTGLSRQYIANLTNYQISQGNAYYSIHFEFGDSVRHIPLCEELTEIIRQYIGGMKVFMPFQKVFDINENYVSEKVQKLSRQITKTAYTPTDFSNTFIKSALSLDNEILAVSYLTLESVSTIAKHINLDDDAISKKQIKVIEGLYREEN